MTPSRDGETFNKDNGTSETSKRDNDISAPYRKDHKTSHGDGDNCLNSDKDSRTTPTGDHQYSVCASRYCRSTTLFSKGGVRKFEAKLKLYRMKEKGSLEKTETKISRI